MFVLIILLWIRASNAIPVMKISSAELFFISPSTSIWVKKQAAQLDGCYVIKTDLSVKVATAETIHDRHKDLAQVERAFRTFKSGLEVRPAFVRKEESTRGHVFVVMLAYLLERELYKYWRRLKVTAEEGIDELGSLRGVEIRIGQGFCQSVPEPAGLN